METIIKPLNEHRYKEMIVRDVDEMNLLLGGADNRMLSISRNKLWAELNMHPYEITFSFYLFKDLTDDDIVKIVDTKETKNMGRGFYSYYFSAEIGKIKCDYKVAGAFIWANPKTEGKKLSGVYVYDVNKAYLATLAPGIYPDTKRGALGAGITAADEIGFSIKDNCITGVVDEGEYADERFYKGYSAKIAEFAKAKGQEMVKLKKQGKTDELKKLKESVNIAIGISRNHNAWFYEYIVGMCGNRMRKLMDENTILCNTDSIFSLTKRDDIPIGDEIGKFKIEHENVEMVHRATNYVLFSGEEYLSMKQRGKIQELQDPEAFVKNAYETQDKVKYKIVSYGKRGSKIYEN